MAAAYEIQCPHCKATLEIPASGRYSCETCGQAIEFEVSPPPAPIHAPANKKPRRSWDRRIAAFSAIALAVIVLGFIVKTVSTNDPRFDAIYESQKEIKKKLMAPSSARFPAIYGQDYKIGEHGDGIAVESWVEAQNPFGVMVRSAWRVELKRSDNAWIIKSSKVSWTNSDF